MRQPVIQLEYRVISAMATSDLTLEQNSFAKTLQKEFTNDAEHDFYRVRKELHRG